VTWRASDLPPEARRAAEDAAAASGTPLAVWLAQTIRAAVIAELGRYPGTRASAPPRDPSLPLDAPATASAATRRAPAPVRPVRPLPPVAGFRSSDLSPESRRAAEEGLGDWLAGRIEGQERRRALAAKQQLDLFGAGRDGAQLGQPPEPAAPLVLPKAPVEMLPMAALRPSRCRARRNEGDERIAALAVSVAVQGVREPLVVRRNASNPALYDVVAGERRRIAAERASRTEVPAIVVEANDSEALMMSVAENLGRSDFSPLDEARAYLRLMTEFGVNPGVLAQRLQRKRGHVARALRLLGLPERVRQYIDGGQISAENAWALLDAADPQAAAEKMLSAAGAPPADA